MSDPRPADRYVLLNGDPPWDGFDLTGLERQADGSLTLTRMPRPIGDIGPPASTPAVLSTSDRGPAGVVASGSDLFASSPAEHRVTRWNSCLSRPEPLPWAGGHGPWPGQLDTPRGLASLPALSGTRLALAESGNHRIQIFDIETGQSLLTIGRTAPDGLPLAGSGPGEFDSPKGLAADATGHLYVADTGNGRIQKLSPQGVPDPAFAANLAAQADPPKRPLVIAMEGDRLYVLDVSEMSARVLTFDTRGNAELPSSFAVDAADPPIALATQNGWCLVGTIGGSLARYDASGRLVSRYDPGGQARPIRALTLTGKTLVASSGDWPLTRFDPAGGYVRSGHFCARPVAVWARPLAWHGLRVEADNLAAASRVQLSTRATSPGATPPDSLSDEDGLPASAGWWTESSGTLDLAILDDDARAALRGDPIAHDPDEAPRAAEVWIAGRLEGDGLVSPVLRQIRLDVAPGSSLRYLPRIHQEGSLIAPPLGAGDDAINRHARAALQSRLLLDLWLAAIDGELDRTTGALESLLRRFDPAAAPTDGLAWLASWLDFDWVESWPETDGRRRLAGAFDLARSRGTAEGLRAYLKLYAGVDAWVEEPSARGGGAPLVLGEFSTLGVDAVLASAPAYGAVLASTATLGASHILDPADGGVPLFADVAHRFCVQVHASQVFDPAALAALNAALVREAPAHTTYHLCILPPRMRVGVQARIGIDTVVGGPIAEWKLSDSSDATAGSLGIDAVLADIPHRSNRLGAGFRVGGSLASAHPDP